MTWNIQALFDSIQYYTSTQTVFRIFIYNWMGSAQVTRKLGKPNFAGPSILQ